MATMMTVAFLLLSLASVAGADCFTKAASELAGCLQRVSCSDRTVKSQVVACRQVFDVTLASKQCVDERMTTPSSTVATVRTVLGAAESNPPVCRPADDESVHPAAATAATISAAVPPDAPAPPPPAAAAPPAQSPPAVVVPPVVPPAAAAVPAAAPVPATVTPPSTTAGPAAAKRPAKKKGIPGKKAQPAGAEDSVDDAAAAAAAAAADAVEGDADDNDDGDDESVAPRPPPPPKKPNRRPPQATSQQQQAVAQPPPADPAVDQVAPDPGAQQQQQQQTRIQRSPFKMPRHRGPEQVAAGDPPPGSIVAQENALPGQQAGPGPWPGNDNSVWGNLGRNPPDQQQRVVVWPTGAQGQDGAWGPIRREAQDSVFDVADPGTATTETVVIESSRSTGGKPRKAKAGGKTKPAPAPGESSSDQAPAVQESSSAGLSEGSTAAIIAAVGAVLVVVVVAATMYAARRRAEFLSSS